MAKCLKCGAGNEWIEGDVRGALRSESSARPTCSTATPWPPRDAVEKLVEATDILLDLHNYDGHGWEMVHEARAVARDWLKR